MRKTILAITFTDAGTVTIKGPGKSADTIRLSRGTIKVKARFTKKPTFDANPKTCLVTEHSGGTIVLSVGTGSYRGISGSGKFTQSTREIAATVHGKCSFSSGKLIGSQQFITASGPVSLP